LRQFAAIVLRILHSLAATHFKPLIAQCHGSTPLSPHDVLTNCFSCCPLAVGANLQGIRLLSWLAFPPCSIRLSCLHPLHLLNILRITVDAYSYLRILASQRYHQDKGLHDDVRCACFHAKQAPCSSQRFTFREQYFEYNSQALPALRTLSCSRTITALIM
jgi:hypothetical protein